MNDMIDFVISIHTEDKKKIALFLLFLEASDLGWEVPSSSDCPSFNENAETYFRVLASANKDDCILSCIPIEDIETAKEYTTKEDSRVDMKFSSIVEDFSNAWLKSLETLNIHLDVKSIEDLNNGIFFVNFSSNDDPSELSKLVATINDLLLNEKISAVCVDKDDDDWYLSLTIDIKYRKYFSIIRDKLKDTLIGK